MIIMMQLAASKLSIWGELREVTREPHAKEDASARGTRAFSGGLLHLPQLESLLEGYNTIYHTLCSLLSFPSWSYSSLSWRCRWRPGSSLQKRNQHINTFIERFHSHATRKCVLDKTSASTGLVWNTIMGAVALFCEERNCRNDERKWILSRLNNLCDILPKR